MGGSYYGEREVYSTASNTGGNTQFSVQAEQVMQQKSLHQQCDPKQHKELSCEAKSPIVVAIDVTGSMGNWSKIIYDKLPMFYGQIMMKNYVEDPALSFAGVGDANCDTAPLQVTEFAQGSAIDDFISKLWLEGGGGGQNYETYELAAYFYSNRCNFSKVKGKGYFFFTGDEGFYPAILKMDIEKFIGDHVKETVPTDQVFQALKEKFHIFFLHKPYYDLDIDRRMAAKWINLIGEENVLNLNDPKAVVDVMLGAISISSGSRTLSTYVKDMEERGQSKERIEEVVAALKLLDAKFSSVHLQKKTTETEAPAEFLCPISNEIMEDPVTLEDGYTYDRQNIEEWLSTRDVSPVTGQLLESKNLLPNKKLQQAITKWRE